MMSISSGASGRWVAEFQMTTCPPVMPVSALVAASTAVLVTLRYLSASLAIAAGIPAIVDDSVDLASPSSTLSHRSSRTS